MNSDYALLIGINHYTKPEELGLPTLKGAINDVTRFEEWLLNKEGGGLDSSCIRKVISEPTPLKPLQSEVDDKLEELLKMVYHNEGKARRFYFYFAGHGLGVDPDISDNALCLANWSELFGRSSALSAKEYRDLLISLGCFTEVIFLADCCRNTKINIRPLKSRIERITAAADSGKTKFFIGYATQFQDQSKEVEDSTTGEKRGAFTKVLIEALEGRAINKEGDAIDADSLRDYLTRFVPLEAQKNGFKQMPDIYHNFSAVEQLVFKKFDPNVSIECHIQFVPSRSGIINLFNEVADVIHTFNLDNKHDFVVTLTPGLYVFKELQTNSKKRFALTPNKTEADVEF